MNPEDVREVQALFRQGMSIRAIARKLGRDPKTIRTALDRQRKEPTPLKLKPFLDLVRDLSQKGLAAPRILREIRERGYTGGLSILKALLKTLRPPRPRPPKVFRRFETKKAEEGQIDWSPYRIAIAGRWTVVHCFSLILAYSRRLWIGFFRNEKLPTLLFAHTEAFRYHNGCPMRLVYDNQTTVTLGRVGGKPLWHPAFLEFVRHYGFTPYACRPRHAERKGKVERPFFWIETDFLKATPFDSWEDLNRKATHWLDTVANVRKHSTTGRRVDDMYAEEKPFLIALPETPFPTERREIRKVQKDGYLPVDGSFYPAPAHLIGQHVAVRIYPSRVEILDASGAVAATHSIPDRPGRIPAPWEIPASEGEAFASATSLDARFLARFPDAMKFLDGLKRRMNALTPIHLYQIERLVDLYDDVSVAAALDRALAYRNFSAWAVTRILEAAHPDVVPEPPAAPLSAGPEILGALDDMAPASPADYTLDSVPPTSGGSHDKDDRPF